MDLSEENVTKALEEAKDVLGTIFGNSAENRNIGITGDVQVSRPVCVCVCVCVSVCMRDMHAWACMLHHVSAL
jgi:hypothetical protein